MDKRILLIDDEEEIRELFAAFFERKGFKTTEAGSGNEAIEILKTQEFDVILSDYRMANGNGKDVLVHVKDNIEKQPIFAFMSGYSDVSVEELKAMGVDLFFNKPIGRKEVLNKINELLEKS